MYAICKITVTISIDLQLQVSSFKGTAWTYSEKRKPDLNYRNEKVVEEIKVGFHSSAIIKIPQKLFCRT